MHVTYHVLQTFLKVAQECFRLVSLDLTVLYGFSIQVIIQLHCKYGSGSTFILCAVVTWKTKKQLQRFDHHINVLVQLIAVNGAEGNVNQWIQNRA